MRVGEVCLVSPADTDDPMAAQWAGEKVKILRINDHPLLSRLVYVSLVEPINGDTRRAVFREQDLKVEGY